MTPGTGDDLIYVRGLRNTIRLGNGPFSSSPGGGIHRIQFLPSVGQTAGVAASIFGATACHDEIELGLQGQLQLNCTAGPQRGHPAFHRVNCTVSDGNRSFTIHFFGVSQEDAELLLQPEGCSN